MTTTAKRWSPRKKKNFKMKFSPKKYNSPKKAAKENKSQDQAVALRKFRQAKVDAMKAKQTSPCKPTSFRFKSIIREAHNTWGDGSPETPKRTKFMSKDSKKLSPLDATEDAVPSFELCAEFGFTGKKAEVARTLIKVQRAFNRLKFNELTSSSPYMSAEFLVLFRETAAMGAKTVSEFKLWDQFELGIIALLKMRLAHYKVPRGTLFKYLGYRIASWNKSVYHAGSCRSKGHSSLTIVPEYGVVKNLVDLAVILHEQIKAVKEFDRADGMTECARKAGYY